MKEKFDPKKVKVGSLFETFYNLRGFLDFFVSIDQKQ